MGKKWLLVLCALTAVVAAVSCWGATTWQLQTKLNNTGGALQVRNKTPQTTAGNVVYHNFTTSAPVPVTVTANTGYKISALSRNGAAVPIGNYTSHFSTTFQKSGGVTQSLVAGFTAQQLTVTALVSGPGSITPATAKVSYGGSAVFTSSPSATGCYLTSVSGGSVTDANGAAITLPYFGSVRITASNVTSARSVTAYYTAYGVDAGVDQLAQVNSTVRLSGSMTGNGSPSWSQIYGPTATLSGAQTLTASFIPASGGTYRFRLTQTVSGVAVASATTEVVVVESLVDDMRRRCMGCHAAAGVYPNPYVFPGWSSSRHQSVGVSCVTCHTDGAMPTPVNSYTVDQNTFAYRSGAGNFCLNGSCHQAGTTHKTVGMSCSGCHGNFKNHDPATTFDAALTVCFTCHGAPNSTHYQVIGSLSGTDCLICHKPTGHDPAPDATVTPAHFNGYTSYVNEAYAAAYVTPVTRCADCHEGGDPKGSADAPLMRYRLEWSGSGHGDGNKAAWKNSAYFDWKTAGTAGAAAKTSASVAADCQRCHSATGYLKFALYTSIEPVSATAARYSEPLTCNACHQSGDFAAPRAVSARTGYYNYSGAVTGRLQVTAPFPDAGRSNLCMGCHVGRQAGATVQALAQATAQKNYSSAFWRNVSFVDSHNLSAGGQLYGTTGYHYPGLSYGNAGVNHTGIGGTGAGPCVACHLPASSHTLSVAEGNFTLCNGCHIDGGTVSSGFLGQRSEEFASGLKALAAALAAKGFTPLTDAAGKPRYPYFNTTNWGGHGDGPGNLGAAFNYNLLAHDPGAFAHNPAYVKRLVRDSIDFLTYGGIDRGRDLGPAIEALLASSGDRERATSFLTFAGSGASACQVCHQGATDPLTGGNIFADYGASLHAKKAGGAACVSCHAPTESSAHPAQPLLKATSDINPKCLNCHPVHTWPSEGICTNCHNGHRLKAVLPAPHLANFTTAQYVTPDLQCQNCHYLLDGQGAKTFVVLPEHRDWAKSAKGDYRSAALTSYDFKTMGTAGASPATAVQKDCVRCHTTTGYNNYVGSDFTDIAPFGTPGDAPGGDRTRQMIGCPACHAPTPFNADYARSIVGKPNYATYTYDAISWNGYSSAATGKIVRSKLYKSANPSQDLGDSNICITCHAGRGAGELIKQVVPGFRGALTCPPDSPSIVCRVGNGTPAAGLVNSFWGNVDFVDPHGGVAPNLMYPGALAPGYEYRPAQTTTSTYHLNIGMDGSWRGPCVGCHMSSPAKHSFKAVSSASNGVISAVTSTSCSSASCHGGTVFAMTASALEAKRTGYRAALSFIAAQLAAKGIHYNRDSYPYFFTTPEPAQQSQATRVVNWNLTGVFQGAHLMGAAFNLRLLDSGSGWVHNASYTKRLLYDTIDYLDDGTPANNSVEGTVLQDPLVFSYVTPRPLY